LRQIQIDGTVKDENRFEYPRNYIQKMLSKIKKLQMQIYTPKHIFKTDDSTFVW